MHLQAGQIRQLPPVHKTWAAPPATQKYNLVLKFFSKCCHCEVDYKPPTKHEGSFFALVIGSNADNKY